jgi:hypothetical protein
VRRKKPRLTDESERHNDRLSLFKHYATGEGPMVGKDQAPEEDTTEELDAEARAAQRLLLPGDAVWPPELVRLREALDRARDDPE